MDNREKKYISFDIEASGPSPGRYSMLSLGACVVGNNDIQFYRELKPISKNYSLEAMRVASRGLRCLDQTIEELNPDNPQFNPSKVLDILEEVGESPENVMKDYAEWVTKNTIGFKPVEAAAPIKFDGMFTTWYFDNFSSRENPFGWSGEDINSMYRGVVRDVNSHIVQLGLRTGKPLTHNALEDAIMQATEFERVLELMRLS